MTTEKTVRQAVADCAAHICAVLFGQLTPTLYSQSHAALGAVIGRAFGDVVGRTIEPKKAD